MSGQTGPGEALVQVRGVSRSFGEREVLREVSLEVRGGEILGLLGPSGAGKTTLVRLIAGADSPPSGEVRVLGDPMPSLALLARIGYMAQSDALYQDLTARENLEFFGALQGLFGPELDRRLASALELVGLAADADRAVAAFSGGMKRRLSLACALLHRPRVLVLDEPTVGIDPALRRSIWGRLREWAAGGAAILLTTHVMDEAEKCDRVAMLRDGRIIASGSPAALKAAAGCELLEEAFLRHAGAKEAPP